MYSFFHIRLSDPGCQHPYPVLHRVFAYVMTLKREAGLTYLTSVPVVTGVIIAIEVFDFLEDISGSLTHLATRELSILKDIKVLSELHIEVDICVPSGKT
ncbi:unnamed protein product [Linum tenue]|nr:unnamed protein product [Linum tenue]